MDNGSTSVRTSLMRPQSGALRARIADDAIILLSQPTGKQYAESSGGVFCCHPGEAEGSNDRDTLIPFSDVVWAKPIAEDDGDLEIDYAKISPSSHKLKLQKVKVQFENLPTDATKKLDEYVLDKAFPEAKFYKMKLMVLINPHGGQGKALEYFNHNARPILDRAHVNYDFVKTEYYGHAVDIARELDLAKYDCILCASGDGIPHEVINGLYSREDRVEAFNKLIVTQIPCGSGNAMSISCLDTLNVAEATLALLKSTITRTDLMAVTQDKGTKLSFLSQTYGIIADSDIGTEWLRFMGPMRFDLGVAIKVFQKATYPCEIYIKYHAKNKNHVAMHYDQHYGQIKDADLTVDSFRLKYPSLDDPVPDDWEKYDKAASKHLGIFYVGKMPLIAKDVNFFPAALPNDGVMDLVITDSRTKLFKLASSLMGLDKGTHILNEEIQHSKILAYRFVPKVKHSYISVDGENFPFEPLQVEILPGILKTALRNGTYIDTGFNSTNSSN